jgi:hypothetical protein
VVNLRVGPRRCDCCGQIIPVGRMGVVLSPFKARIFDLIKARPGISRKELCYELYESVTQANLMTTGAHVAQLRQAFSETDILIRARTHHGYRITKRRTQRMLED